MSILGPQMYRARAFDSSPMRGGSLHTWFDLIAHVQEVTPVRVLGEEWQ